MHFISGVMPAPLLHVYLQSPLLISRCVVPYLKRIYRTKIQLIRHPVKVFTEDNREIDSTSRNIPIQHKLQRYNPNRTATVGVRNIDYEKLEDDDKRFGKVLSTNRSRKTRNKANTILLEGRRLIVDAISSGLKLDSIYFSKVECLEGIPFDESVPLYKVLYKHLQKSSDVVSSPGVLGVCRSPDVNNKSNKLPIILVCDNIRDPGNMGTIIRSAAAVGCQQILATKGTVDVWEQKVLRSATGGHFKVPIIQSIPWDLLSSYIPEDSHVLLADNKANITDHEELSSTILGNTPGNSDTLNLDKKMPVDKKEYYNVDYAQKKSITLVVGGETEGLSSTAHKLAYDRSGQKVYIPMLPTTDSLNSAVAASIILFEISKQIFPR